MSLTLEYTGNTPYVSDYPEGAHSLLVAVECVVGDFPAPVRGLLDTAATWCVLLPEIARHLGYDADPYEHAMSTRFGTFHGRLHRIPVRFPAREGTHLEISATWFVSDDWPGPMVIGWKGCLERLRLALEPEQNLFYFAPIGGATGAGSQAPVQTVAPTAPTPAAAPPSRGRGRGRHGGR